MPRQFDYDPNPGFDKMSDCFSAGWKYIRQDGDPVIDPEDPESKRFAIDPLFDLNTRKGMKPEDRSPERAAEILRSDTEAKFAAYVMGAGVVYDVSADPQGRVMVLTSLEELGEDKKLRKIKPRNTYSDEQRSE